MTDRKPTPEKGTSWQYGLRALDRAPLREQVALHVGPASTATTTRTRTDRSASR